MGMSCFWKKIGSRSPSSINAIRTAPTPAQAHTSLAGELAGKWQIAMDKFRTPLYGHGKTGQVLRVDPAADTVTGFQYNNCLAGFGQTTGCGQAGGAGSKDKYI
jgi:hypothetical protein